MGKEVNPINPNRPMGKEGVTEWEALTMNTLRATGLEKPSFAKTVLIKEKWKELKRKILSLNQTGMKELIISVSGVKGEYKKTRRRR